MVGEKLPHRKRGGECERERGEEALKRKSSGNRKRYDRINEKKRMVEDLEGNINMGHKELMMEMDLTSQLDGNIWVHLKELDQNIRIREKKAKKNDRKVEVGK